MKSKFLCILLMLVLVLGGCTQAENVDYNLSTEADNFNIVREITVINCLTGDILFQMSGRLSITHSSDKLVILVEDDGSYLKHIIGLSDNVTYVVEDLNLGENEVSKYRYTLNFNPKMMMPFDVEYID